MLRCWSPTAVLTFIRVGLVSVRTRCNLLACDGQCTRLVTVHGLIGGVLELGDVLKAGSLDHSAVLGALNLPIERV